MRVSRCRRCFRCETEAERRGRAAGRGESAGAHEDLRMGGCLNCDKSVGFAEGSAPCATMTRFEPAAVRTAPRDGPTPDSVTSECTRSISAAAPSTMRGGGDGGGRSGSGAGMWSRQSALALSSSMHVIRTLRVRGDSASNA
eukprot:scaffold8418_cov106-Isochrysis_galbana.AAC.2